MSQTTYPPRGVNEVSIRNALGLLAKMIPATHGVQDALLLMGPGRPADADEILDKVIDLNNTIYRLAIEGQKRREKA